MSIEPHSLSDDDLLAAISRLAARSHETTADLLRFLIEMERRDLHLACGFKSLFGYCRRVLHFSEGGSYDRMKAAHAAARVPVILAMLSEGRLHLTSVRLLAPHLKDENHLALLGGAIRKSGRDVRELLARWFPRPDVSTVVRRLPESRPPGAPLDARPLDAPLIDMKPAQQSPVTPDKKQDDRPAGPAEVPDRPTPASPPRTRTVEPLSAGRYAFRFTGDEETASLLREAQELLSHELPDGDVAAIVKRGLALVVAAARKAKRGATTAPSRSDAKPTSAHSRNVPASVRRTVDRRDDGQCTYVGLDGRRCEERRFLQYHHRRPWAVGGRPTAENIALLCEAHNQYEARVYFGPIRKAMDSDR